jgi:hypothetical protein
MTMRGRRTDSHWSVVLDAPDARSLARFYLEMLGWTLGSDDPDWVTIRPPDGHGYLSFQTNEGYRPPVWPAAADDQQQQLLTARFGAAPNNLRCRYVEWRATCFRPGDGHPAGHPYPIMEEVLRVLTETPVLASTADREFT